MFESERLFITSRLSDVRQFLDLIKRLESDNPLVPDNAEVQMLRGLFFVHLYATFEFSVSTLVQSTLRQIHNHDIVNAHVNSVLHSVSLDAAFDSCKTSGAKNKWNKRVELIAKMSSLDKCSFNDTVFSGDLQNVWVREIRKVFSCLGIDEPVVPEQRLLGYIDETVDKRNAVSHGREAPADVAAGLRSPDLQIRLNAVSDTIYYLTGCFERYVSGRFYISIQHRARYVPAG